MMRTPSGRSSSADAKSGWPATLGGATTTMRPISRDRAQRPQHAPYQRHAARSARTPCSARPAASARCRRAGLRPERSRPRSAPVRRRCERGRVALVRGRQRRAARRSRTTCARSGAIVNTHEPEPASSALRAPAARSASIAVATSGACAAITSWKSFCSSASTRSKSPRCNASSSAIDTLPLRARCGRRSRVERRVRLRRRDGDRRLHDQ